MNGAANEDSSRASEALHARVRAFAHAALEREPEPGAFESLALDIARFQLAHNRAFARLCGHHGAELTSLARVPPLPADAFRLGRIAAHSANADVARFFTSGTTGGSGCHALRTLDTYAELSVAWGRRALFGTSAPRATVLALAPPFEPEHRSSLGYMMQQFMQSFDGRSLAGGAFDPLEPGRWLLGGERVDVAGLRRGMELAQRRGEPLLLLGTSFALVWLLDELGAAELPLPPGSTVMWTGGFKGRSRSVDAAELGRAICRALCIQPRRLIGEYGMTELSSQLYDRGASAAGEPSPFVEPPWLRVTPVDPISLEPVAPGEVGLACFTDLANVDSALEVLTQDRVRRVPGGIALVGRQTGARPRGCSLAIEALASGRGPA
jgi:hypothetical protein